MAISDYFTMCYIGGETPTEVPHEAYPIVAAGAIPYGGAQASKYGSGFRFHLDIPIPAGAIIISATLTLYGHDLGIPSGIGTKAYISGENTNTPVEFTAGDIPTFLTRRANIVPTQIAYDDVSQYYGATPNVLPDISAIIQEIIANGETSDISLFLDDFDNRSTDMHLYLFQPASATLEIVYEADCYVTYDANGGTGTVPVDSTVYDQLDIVTVLGNIDLTKTGYVYSSWNTSADGTGTDYEAGDTFSIVQNTTLYAKWRRRYKPNQIVKKGYLNYICILEHDATDDTEPEVGINWELYWRNLTEFFRHNDLLDFQGGDTTAVQFYHLIKELHDDLVEDRVASYQGQWIANTYINVYPIYVDGVLWTGNVLTVGVGKDVADFETALDQVNNVDQVPTVLLIFGTVRADRLSGNFSNNYPLYIRGIDDDASIIIGSTTTQEFQQGATIYLDNVSFSSPGLDATEGGIRVTTGSLKTNKAKIKVNGELLRNTCPIYSNTFFTEISLSYTDLEKTFPGGWHLNVNSESDKDKIYLDKVGYDYTWTGDTGFALEDTEPIGTSGYGYSAGTAGELISVVGDEYKKNQIVTNNDNLYVCLIKHVALPDTEPGVGEEWETYWALLGTRNHNDLSGLQGGDSTSSEYYHLTQTEYDRINPATETTLGVVKIGDGLTITAEGILTVDEPATDHNYLNGLQGGDSTSSEYYHVTSIEKTVIENTSGINTGDQTSSDFDHDLLTNTHNLTTDIDHNSIDGLQGGDSTSSERYHLNSTDYLALTDAQAQLENLQTDKTPTFAGVTLGDAGKVTWDIVPASDHTATGNIANMTAGEALTYGQCCYLKSDGKWYKADSDSSSTMPAMAIVADSAGISAAANGNFLIGWTQVIRDDSWDWVIGAPIYVSGTAGGFTQTVPTTNFSQVQVMGFALTANVIALFPVPILVEVGLLAENGYQWTGKKLEQWGAYTTTLKSDAEITITFPVEFPNACFHVDVSMINGEAGSLDWTLLVKRETLTKTGVTIRVVKNGANPDIGGFYWRAIGY